MRLVYNITCMSCWQFSCNCAGCATVLSSVLRGLGSECVYMQYTVLHHICALFCVQLAQPQAVAAPPIPPAAVKKFRQDCVKVLSAEPGHKVLLIRFHEAYLKQFGHQFSLSQYGAKKLINLFEAIPDVVKVWCVVPCYFRGLVCEYIHCTSWECVGDTLNCSKVSPQRYSIQYHCKAVHWSYNYFNSTFLFNLWRGCSLLELSTFGQPCIAVYVTSTSMSPLLLNLVAVLDYS